MKVYRMVIEKITRTTNEPRERKAYESTHQGTAPSGWKCVAVRGYYEKR